MHKYTKNNYAQYLKNINACKYIKKPSHSQITENTLMLINFKKVFNGNLRKIKNHAGGKMD